MIQDMPDWADLLNYADVVITIQTKDVTLTDGTADIIMATCDTKRAGSFDAVPDGPRWDAYTETGITSNQWYKKVLTLEQSTVTASTKPIDRWLCWLLKVNKGATGGPFSITFEVSVTAKVAA